MILNIVPGAVSGLTNDERRMLMDLVQIYNAHSLKNAEKDKYYEGKISLNSVNLGIALPDGLAKLEIGCAWGAKCVDVLAARSMFDGFVGENGEDVDALDKIVVDNRLIAEYMKACRDELRYGCDFATLSADPEIGCKIRFHSPRTATAKWDGDLGRIAYGMAIIDTAPDNTSDASWSPSVINLYLDYAVIVLRRDGSLWKAERYSQSMGRIKEPVRRLIDGYVRTIANATIGLEFATSPQKYLLGVTDDQYDVLINQKFKQYVGSIIASTTNPETGEKPSFGQLTQGNISPHTEMIRILSTQFSAATGLTVTDTGVVNDANPTSSDAILAQSQTLVAMAEQLNTGNGDALRMIALMALAISSGRTLEDLGDEEKAVIAHFKNPAMPSVAVTADAAIKLASVRPNFGETDTFLEMVGFDKADIRRIKAQEQMARGRATLEEFGV